MDIHDWLQLTVLVLYGVSTIGSFMAISAVMIL